MAAHGSRLLVLLFLLSLLAFPVSAQVDETMFEFARNWTPGATEDPWQVDDLLRLLGGNWVPPPASFIALPGSGPAPLSVEFRYADPIEGTQIESWAWDFNGDDIVDSTASNPIHVYVASGTYTVTLRVESASGETSIRSIPGCVSVREAVETVVADNVVVVDNDPCLSFVSKTTGELVLEHTCSLQDPISVGSIVVGSDEDGYARRVLGIDVNGALHTYDTENVALTDIFHEADISGLLEFTPEDLQKAGFRIGPDGVARKSFEGEIVAGVEISGDLQFDPALEWDCNIGWSGLKYLRAIFVGTLGVDFKTNIDVTGGLHREGEEVALATVRKWGWYQIGTFPCSTSSRGTINSCLEIGSETTCTTSLKA